MNRHSSVVAIAGFLLVLCSLGGTCPPPQEDKTFAVPEMLGEVTSSSAVIFTQLGSDVTPQYSFKVGYDTSSHASDHQYLFTTSITEGKNANDILTFTLSEGIAPNTRYYYSVAYRESPTQQWNWRTERTFTTPRAAGSPFRFAIISDLHYDGYGTATKQKIIQNVATDHPDFVVMLGDMVPASDQGCGNPPNCTNAYAHLGIGSQSDADYWYKGFAKLLAECAHSSMPIGINGNHEGLAGYLAGCPQYQWVLNARTTYIPLLNHDEPNGFFGSLVWGDVHIIWLDPLAFSIVDPYWTNNPAGYRLGEAQSAFLSATLAASSSRWKLIFAHSLFGGIPNDPCSLGRAYGRGNANFVNTPGTDQISIQSLMEDHGVSAYFYGHDHMFSISELNGVTYVLVGSGAVGWWTDCLKEKYQPWSALTELGHVRVDVTYDALQLRYIKAAFDSTNGQVLYTHYIYPR